MSFEIGNKVVFTRPTLIETPWAVICPNHGKEFLTHEQYMDQLCLSDLMWKCPICSEYSEWCDENFDEWKMEITE